MAGHHTGFRRFATFRLQACASWHKLYGEGQLIGPDLAGGGRHDINYLVEKIVDPSALLAADYRMSSAQVDLP